MILFLNQVLLKKTLINPMIFENHFISSYNCYLNGSLHFFFLRIYLVTWNVNGKPPPDNFTDLLQLKADPLPDLYAIGYVA